MKPIFMTFGNAVVYSWGVMLLAGLLISAYGLIRGSRQGGLMSPAQCAGLIFGALLGGIIGGRVFYVLIQWEYYESHVAEIFEFWRGGLIFYGGLFGSLLVMFVIMRAWKIPVLRGFDFFTPYAALLQAFGRLGCFLNGCCLGKASTHWGTMTFPGESFSRYPAPLYEAVLLFFLFVVLNRHGRIKYPEGERIAYYGMVCGVVRFQIEFIRVSDMSWGGLSLHQWISLCVIIGAAVFWARIRKKESCDGRC